MKFSWETLYYTLELFVFAFMLLNNTICVECK